jgi:MFS family permease
MLINQYENTQCYGLKYKDMKFARTTLAQLFPTFGSKNILLYYVIVAFSSAWFIIANWLFFVLRFISAYDMAVLEAVSFGIGLLLEIPSGAIADLIGKKKTVQLGLFLQTIGMIMLTLPALSVWFLIFGNITIIAAFAFISGSLEALAYDTLVEEKQEDKYEKVASKIGMIYPIVFVFGAFGGGLMWKVSEYLPFIMSTICFAIAFILSFKLREPTVDTYQFSFKQFVTQNVEGFKQLTNKNLLHFLPIFIAVAASYYMWNTGIIRILMGEEFGYNGETLSYLVGGTMIISSIILHYFDKLKHYLGNKRGLVLIVITTMIAWLLAALTNNIIIGALVFVLLVVSGQLHTPWVSSILNKHVPSKLRATSISTMQFFVQIPYVLVVIFYGSLVNQKLTYLFYFAVFVILGLSLVASFVLAKQKNKRLV